jgi:hypothetical protein
MAVTPEQAIQLAPADFEQVHTLEKDIDSKLLSSFNTSMPKYDYLLKSDGTTKPKLKVILEVLRRYEVSGWRVTLAREGDEIFAIVLEAPNLMPPPMTVHKRLMEPDAE